MQPGTTTSSTVLLRLLGAPCLHLGDGSIHPLERKDAALFALLALERSIPRSRALAWLWPDASDAAARNNLRQRLFRLRKLAERDLVTAERDVLSLAAGVTHDVDADPAALPLDGAASAAQQRAELLGTFDYTDCTELNEWLAALRAQRREARRAALHGTIDDLERDGQIALALQYCNQLVGEDPLHEHAYRRLMHLHHLRGDRAAALATFERCRTVLAQELRAAPSAETLQLADAIGASAAPTPGSAAPHPVAVLRPPRLVGRDAEWHALEQAWSTRRVAIVTGEPGIGKTRLLADFGAAHGAIVVGSRPGDAHVAHTLIRRLLRALLERGHRLEEMHEGAGDKQWARRELARIVPDFDPAWSATGDVDTVRLAQAVQLLLASAERPNDQRAVVIDDLQFADVESLRVLTLVVRNETGETRWLLGARAHELPPVAQHWISGHDPAALVHLALLPFDVDGVRSLLATLDLASFDPPRWAPAIHRHTGGNAMFILETLRALMRSDTNVAHLSGETLPLPERIEQLIAERLLRLSPLAQQLARVAALAGLDFSAELAGRVLRVHALDLIAPWKELEAAHIIRNDGFAHDLVLEATQKLVPDAEACALHASIAAYLAGRGAAHARVAWHWRKARAWNDAARVYVAAAQQARTASRRAEELALLRHAAECQDRSGRNEGRYEIELRSAQAALLIDRTDQARDYAAAALACATTAADRAEAHSVCAEVAGFLADGAKSVEHAAAGLHAAHTVGAPALVLRLAGSLGRLHVERGEFDAGSRVFDDHARWLDAGAGTAAERTFLINRALVLHQGRSREEAVAAAERALASANADRDWADAYQCHSHLAAFKARLGRSHEALGHLQHALGLREEIGAAGGQTEIARFYLGVILEQEGRYSEAFELLSTAYTRFNLGQVRTWAVITENLIARMYDVFGQPARAFQLLGDVEADLPAVARAMRHINQARVLRSLGRPRGALIADALALHAHHRQHDADLMAQLQQAIDSAPAAGAELAARIEAEALDRMHVPLQLDAQSVACACLLKAGSIEAAASKARALLVVAEHATPWTSYTGEIFWNAHLALAAAGDHAAARTALERGVSWVETRLPNVPAEFKDSFLNRNPVNRAILTTASRLLKK